MAAPRTRAQRGRRRGRAATATGPVPNARLWRSLPPCDRIMVPTMVITRPSRFSGLIAAVVTVVLATLAIYPLKSIAPVVSLSVVYLPAVLVIAAYWGLGLGLLTSLASAAAFNWFHLPPTHKFTVSDSRNWVALMAFILVALVVSTMAEVARARAAEAERR